MSQRSIAEPTISNPIYNGGFHFIPLTLPAELLAEPVEELTTMNGVMDLMHRLKVSSTIS